MLDCGDACTAHGPSGTQNTYHDSHRSGVALPTITLVTAASVTVTGSCVLPVPAPWRAEHGTTAAARPWPRLTVSHSKRVRKESCLLVMFWKCSGDNLILVYLR